MAGDFDAIPASADLRLVAIDMDGTLLDADHQIPDGFWPVVDALRERGVQVVPASGRQLATLRDMFPAELSSFIAENGTLVVADGEVVSTTTIDASTAHAVIARMRELIDGGLHAEQVVCGVESAYIEADAPEFADEVRRYYHALTEVDDLLAPNLIGAKDEVLKIAIYDFVNSEAHTSPGLRHFEPEVKVVVSGEHWVDVVPAAANKGAALAAMQRSLGVTREQTAVFGDFLNDLEMLGQAHWSFAMANAHPDVIERAAFRAPSNAEAGVVQVLRAYLEGNDEARH